jgi:hypothetical protein
MEAVSITDGFQKCSRGQTQRKPKPKKWPAVHALGCSNPLHTPRKFGDMGLRRVAGGIKQGTSMRVLVGVRTASSEKNKNEGSGKIFRFHCIVFCNM